LKTYFSINYALLESVSNSLADHGHNVNVTPNPSMLSRMQGASEKDIVHSGLQYTMERSARHIIAKAHEYNTGMDIRNAAFIVAAEKVYLTTNQQGTL
jgi:glutamate dehydrogenase (NAD(P)+)